MEKSKILSIKKVGKKKTYNIEMKSNQHNYLVQNKEMNSVVSKNSTAYAEITYQTAYLKTYYPTEFMCAILTSAANSSDKKFNYVKDKFAEEYKLFKIEKPTVNRSKEYFIPGDKKYSVIAPLFSLKSIGQKASQHIVDNQPYINIDHFLDKIDRRIVTSNVLKILNENKAFKDFGNEDEINITIKKYDQSMKINKGSSKPKSKVSLGSLF